MASIRLCSKWLGEIPTTRSAKAQPVRQSHRAVSRDMQSDCDLPPWVLRMGRLSICSGMAAAQDWLKSIPIQASKGGDRAWTQTIYSYLSQHSSWHGWRTPDRPGRTLTSGKSFRSALTSTPQHLLRVPLSTSRCPSSQPHERDL